MPVTLRDIARRADVSHATVSVVLNQRSVPIIGERTRQRVLKVAAELGYQPNHLARALATGRSYIIAVWVVDPYNPYAAQTLNLLQTIARTGPYALMAVEAPPPEVANSGFPPRSHWPVDAVIAMDCPERVSQMLGGPQPPKTPIVSLGRVFSTQTDYVGIDNAAGVREALDHLVKTGRRSIALLSVDDAGATAPVTSAYLEGMAAAGLPTEIIQATAATRYAGREAVVARLQKGNPPDAILAFNDLLAVGALKALRDGSVAVPGKVAVVACSGTDELAYDEPAITVVEHPLQQMCELGWQFLQNRMTALSGPPQQLILKPQLVVRASSAS